MRETRVVKRMVVGLRGGGVDDWLWVEKGFGGERSCGCGCGCESHFCDRNTHKFWSWKVKENIPEFCDSRIRGMVL